MQNRCILDGLLRLFLNRGYLTSGAVSVKAMEIAIYICIAGTSIAFTYFLVRLKTGERPFNPGTVILHQIPRDLFTTLSGPRPCLKLETFLRMTKIHYQNIYSVNKASEKGKYPWIEFNHRWFQFLYSVSSERISCGCRFTFETHGKSYWPQYSHHVGGKHKLVGRIYCSQSPMLLWDCRDRVLCVTAQRTHSLFV